MPASAPDFRRVNVHLESTLKTFSEQLTRLVTEADAMDDAAFGPGSSQPQTGANAGEAGEGGATNYSDVENSFDMFYNSVVQALQTKYDDLDDDDCDAIFYDTADELSDDGVMLPFPYDSDSDDDLAAWLGSAKSVGFTAAALKMAEED